MYHGIDYKIIDIINQLFFIYKSFTLEFWVFITFLTKLATVIYFIQVLKAKQEFKYNILANNSLDGYYILH